MDPNELFKDVLPKARPLLPPKDRGALEAAVKQHLDAYAQYRKRKDKQGMARELLPVSVDLVRLGRVDEALRHMGEAKQLCLELGQTGAYARAVFSVGLAFREQRNWQLARKVFEESVFYFGQSKDLRSVAAARNNLGIVLHGGKMYHVAYRVFLQALEICKYLGDQLCQAQNLFWIGLTLPYLGRFKDATAAMQKAGQLFTSTDSEVAVFAKKLGTELEKALASEKQRLEALRSQVSMPPPPTDEFDIQDWALRMQGAFGEEPSRDEAEALRIFAIGTGRAKPDKQTTDMLIRAIREHPEDSFVLTFAAEGLGKSQDPRAVEWLIPLLDHWDARVRSSAAGALGAIGDRRAVLHVAELLYDHNSVVRMSSAGALARIGDPSILEGLKSALQRETDEKAREMILEATRRFGARPGEETAKAACPGTELDRLLDSRIRGPLTLYLRLRVKPNLEATAVETIQRISGVKWAERTSETNELFAFAGVKGQADARRLLEEVKALECVDNNAPYPLDIGELQMTTRISWLKP